ncbi:MAG: site-specific integrase [Phycisphaeraceae bacterium]|nr:site-specific integrase [Phycisphaeraceae bacterium]MBX3408227.1 site-specific integrase [Phycisphaeraceae bacterium]
MGRVYKRDGKYWIDYVDHRGKRIRRSVALDKSVAQKVLGDAMAAGEKMKAGVLLADPRQGKRPFQEHVDAYVDDLERRGRDQMYRYIVRKHLEAAAIEQGWQRVTDVTPREVTAYLRVLAGRKLSGKTVNDYRADIAAFLGWCVRNAILESNACDQVPKGNAKTDKTRRALSIAECRALLAASPPERRVVYLFLIFTGLRRAEAAALRWGDVHLDVANPFLEVPASITKSGRHETVPLVPDLAEALRGHRGDARAATPVFEEIPSMPVFRRDLAGAGIEEEDGRGRKVVLHCLRHSLATMLATSGVPMAYAQRIMRHRDIRLTAEVYTDESLLPLSGAMNALPSMSLPLASDPAPMQPGDHSLGFAGQVSAKNVPTVRHNLATAGTPALRGAVAAAS